MFIVYVFSFLEYLGLFFYILVFFTTKTPWKFYGGTMMTIWQPASHERTVDSSPILLSDMLRLRHRS